MLKSVLTQMAHSYTQPHDRSNTFIPLELIHLKTLLVEGLINFRILFLKLTKIFEFGRAGSKLFRSMTVERKKEILTKL